MFSYLSVVTDYRGEKTKIKLLMNSDGVVTLLYPSYSRFSAEQSKLSVVFAEVQNSMDPVWLFQSNEEIIDVQPCYCSFQD